ncbi:unnamed protein product [Ectocarpus sp. 12 AP-2014]
MDVTTAQSHSAGVDLNDFTFRVKRLNSGARGFGRERRQ